MSVKPIGQWAWVLVVGVSGGSGTNGNILSQQLAEYA
jgi:hypothetical protein